MSRIHNVPPIFLTMLFVVLGSLQACVSTTDFDRLRSQVYSHEQERKKQDERIVMLEGELSRTKQEVTQPIQSAQANSWAEINTLRSQVAALNGQMDDLQRSQRVQSSDNSTITLETLHAQLLDLERKNLFMATQLGIVFDEMPTNAAPSSSVTVPTQAAQASPAVQPAQATQAKDDQPESTETASSGGGSQELYQRALEGFYAKKYKQAQTTWAEFVKGFPKDPLVPNALFWQGECFFQLQDYANAVLAYQKVIEDHPKSNKYRAALLKQGMSFFKLKKDQAGKLVLEDLIKKNPDSAEAKRAQAFLKSSK